MPIPRTLLIVGLAIVAPVLFWTGCEQPTEVRTEIRTEVDTLRVTVTDTLALTDTLVVTDTLTVTVTDTVFVTDTLTVFNESFSVTGQVLVDNSVNWNDYRVAVVVQVRDYDGGVVDPLERALDAWVLTNTAGDASTGTIPYQLVIRDTGHCNDYMRMAVYAQAGPEGDSFNQKVRVTTWSSWQPVVCPGSLQRDFDIRGVAW